MSNQVSETIAQALIEYGEALRGDWGDFDGRTARAILNDFAAELRGEREPHTIEQHRDELGLCPDGGGHWGGRWGHCDTYECPTYIAELKAEKENAAK